MQSLIAYTHNVRAHALRSHQIVFAAIKMKIFSHKNSTILQLKAYYQIYVRTKLRIEMWTVLFQDGSYEIMWEAGAVLTVYNKRRAVINNLTTCKQ